MSVCGLGGGGGGAGVVCTGRALPCGYACVVYLGGSLLLECYD